MNYNRKNIMKMAWGMVKFSGKTLKEALKTAWTVAKEQMNVLKAETYEYFEIEFVKISTGEITKRVGSNGRLKKGNLLFHSISDNGFRSAKVENILSVKPVNVNFQVG